MRITNSMMVNRMMGDLNRNLGYLDALREKAADGKDIHRPSDDPIRVTRAMQLHTSISKNEMFHANSELAYSYLENMDISLKEMTSVMDRIRELATEGANGTLTKEDMEKKAMEVQELKEHLIKSGNGTYLNNYVFSGYQTDKEYLREDGSPALNTSKEIKTSFIDLSRRNIDIVAGVNDTFEIDVSGLTGLNGEKYTGKQTVKIAAGTYTTVEDISKEIEKSLNSPTTTPLNMSYTDVDGTYTGADGLIVDTDGYYPIEVIKANAPTVPADPNYNNFQAGDEITFNFGAELKDTEDELRDTIATEMGLTKDDISVVKMENNKTVVVSIKKDNTTVPCNKNWDFKGKLNPVEETVFKVDRDDPASADQGPMFQTANKIAFEDLASNDIVRLKEKDFKVEVNENGTLSITNKLIDDTKGFALKSDSSVANRFDLGEIGLTNFTIAKATESKQYQLGLSLKQDINILGYEVFGPTYDTDGDGMGDKTIIQSIDDLINNLNNGDHAKVSAMIDEIGVHSDHITELRGKVGARMKSVEVTRDRLEKLNVNIKSVLSNTEDANIAEVYTKMSVAESIYRSSMMVGSRIVQPTLVDFLR